MYPNPDTGIEEYTPPPPPFWAEILGLAVIRAKLAKKMCVLTKNEQDPYANMPLSLPCSVYGCVCMAVCVFVAGVCVCL